MSRCRSAGPSWTLLLVTFGYGFIRALGGGRRGFVVQGVFGSLGHGSRGHCLKKLSIFECVNPKLLIAMKFVSPNG